MDPCTAIGTASAILSFIEFSAKLIATANEIRSSTSGLKDEHEEIGLAIGRLEDLTGHLAAQDLVNNTPTHRDRKLLELKKGCTTVSSELQKILQSIRAKKPASKHGSIQYAFKTWRHQGKIVELQSRLDRYRQEVLSLLAVLMK